MICSECPRSTSNPYALTCSTYCSNKRENRLARARYKALREAGQAAVDKDSTLVPARSRKPARKLCRWCEQPFGPKPGENPTRFASRRYCCPEHQRKQSRRNRMLRDQNPSPLPFTPPSAEEREKELKDMLTEVPEGTAYHEYALERLERLAS